MSTPFDGLKQVHAFGPDEEYDDEQTEEFYVTLDLGQIDPTLLPSSSTYRLAGLDTPTPYLQLSGVVMRGQHQTLLGTELLFTDPPENEVLMGNQQMNSSQTKKKSDVEFFASTERRIRFKEVHVKPKPKETGANANGRENSRKPYNLTSDAVLEKDDATNVIAGPSKLQFEQTQTSLQAALTQTPAPAPAPEQSEFQIDPFLLSLSAEALAEGTGLQLHSDSSLPGPSSTLFAGMMAANGSMEMGDESRDEHMNGSLVPDRDPGGDGTENSTGTTRGISRGRGRGRRGGRGRVRGGGRGLISGRGEDPMDED